MARPLQISCVSANWRSLVIGGLTGVREINLIHFLFKTDDEFCQQVAAKYLMEFTSSTADRVAFFRKRPRI